MLWLNSWQLHFNERHWPAHLLKWFLTVIKAIWRRNYVFKHIAYRLDMTMPKKEHWSMHITIYKYWLNASQTKMNVQTIKLIEVSNICSWVLGRHSVLSLVDNSWKNGKRNFTYLRKKPLWPLKWHCFCMLCIYLWFQHL